MFITDLNHVARLDVRAWMNRIYVHMDNEMKTNTQIFVYWHLVADSFSPKHLVLPEDTGAFVFVGQLLFLLFFLFSTACPFISPYARVNAGTIFD